MNGVTTEYFYSGSLLVAQQTGDEILMFFYDESGSPLGFRYRNGTYGADVWDEYIYEKNLQGDIVAVYNNIGTYLVSYTYDSWGNVNKSYYNGGSNTGASKNPLTYRGYYYDTDLAMYYLQSRYYDAKMGRFVNADAVGFLGANGDLNSYNLYAYCSNNPVMYTDPSGNFAIWAMVLVATLVGAAIGFGSDVGKQLINNSGDFNDIDWGSAVNSGIVGGALGFSLAMGVGYLGPTIAGTAAAGSLTAGGAFAVSTVVSFGAGSLGYALEEQINEKKPSFEKAVMHGGFVALEGMVKFGAGGIVGSLGNVGTKGRFLTSKEWWTKLILGLEFTQPFKFGIDFLRKNI